MDTDWTTWRTATERALYDPPAPGRPAGFFVRESPAAHFRTSVHASVLFADAVARLLRRVDRSLGGPEQLAMVDVGAGRGELLSAVLAALPEDVAARVRPYGVERADRPAGLDPRIEWCSKPPARVTGLLFANEWLDNIPVDVTETDSDGVPRQVLVRNDGSERHGAPLSGPDAEWLARWWPLDGAEHGRRAEIGQPRDEAWAASVGTLDAGVAVAVDYTHTREQRPLFGSLTGYRDGREVDPVPDGSRDITAHVAIDSCAVAGAAGGGETAILTQRAALGALGVVGGRPPLALASSDPAAYVRALSSAGEAAELTDRAGLGSFTWLLQAVGGCPLPDLDAGITPPT